MTHISYECAKRLKEFLGESAPEPMKGEMGTIWIYDPECPEDGMLQGVSLSAGDYPAYALHDLLSKKFCEAMFPKLGWLEYRDVQDEVYWAWQDGGLPAVEKALLEMMEGK